MLSKITSLNSDYNFNTRWGSAENHWLLGHTAFRAALNFTILVNVVQMGLEAQFSGGSAESDVWMIY